MVRIIGYILIITIIAAIITWLGGVDGTINARVGDYIVHVSVGVLIGIGVLALGAAIFFTAVTKDLIALPSRLRLKREKSKRQYGMLALTRGLEAVAAGDATDAQRHARHAVKNLEEPSLTRLLTAQAAQLAGDVETANASFTAMLEAPETAFLGLRGLYLQAMTNGDEALAHDYATRAFRLRPNAQWAFQSVYQLSIDRGGWGEAQAALQLASHNLSLDADILKRRKAALATASAYAAFDSGDRQTAQKELDQALKLAPGFAPAAVLAAAIYSQKGSRSKAARILETAYAVDPHPGLSKALEQVWEGMPPRQFALKLRRLVEKAAFSPESRLVLGEAHILLEEWAEAQDMLRPLMAMPPRARAFLAMAAAMRGKYGDEAAAPWLNKAAAAPTERLPGADGQFHLTTEGWRRLVEEYGTHNRLVPPPFEEIPAGLSQDEVKLLTAAPARLPQQDADEDTGQDEKVPDEKEAPDDATPSDTGAPAQRSRDTAALASGGQGRSQG